MNDKITFDQVQKVNIFHPCMKISPCRHKSEIILTDARKKI
jgi:hypothetical protein